MPAAQGTTVYVYMYLWGHGPWRSMPYTCTGCVTTSGKSGPWRRQSRHMWLQWLERPRHPVDPDLTLPHSPSSGRSHGAMKRCLPSFTHIGSVVHPLSNNEPGQRAVGRLGCHAHVEIECAKTGTCRVTRVAIDVTLDPNCWTVGT